MVSHKSKKRFNLLHLPFDAAIVIALVLFWLRCATVPRKVGDDALLSAVERSDAAAVKWLSDR